MTSRSKTEKLICSTVDTGSPTGVYLVQNDANVEGNFCCGNYDDSTSSCVNGTHGASAPFTLPPGKVIYNRTDGSILNGTLTGDREAVTVTSTLR